MTRAKNSLDTWNLWIEELQGHPSRCCSSVGTNTAQIEKDIQGYFPDKNQPVLILGCGDGKEAQMFLDLGFTDVVGLTLSEENIIAARNDYPKVNLVTSDMHNLSIFDRNTFKYVYCNQVFEHAFAPFIFCLEVYTILKEYGIWYAKFPAHETSSRNKLEDPMTRSMSHHHPNMIRDVDFKKLLKLTGFKQEFVKMGQNNEFFVSKIPINSLESEGVHPTVVGAIRKRSSIR